VSAVTALLVSGPPQSWLRWLPGCIPGLATKPQPRSHPSQLPGANWLICSTASRSSIASTRPPVMTAAATRRNHRRACLVGLIKQSGRTHQIGNRLLACLVVARPLASPLHVQRLHVGESDTDIGCHHRALRPAQPPTQLRLGECGRFSSRSHAAQVPQAHITARQLRHPALFGDLYRVAKRRKLSYETSIGELRFRFGAGRNVQPGGRNRLHNVGAPCCPASEPAMSSAAGTISARNRGACRVRARNMHGQHLTQCVHLYAIHRGSPRSYLSDALVVGQGLAGRGAGAAF